MHDSPLDIAMDVALLSQADLASQLGVSVSLVQAFLRQSRTGNGRLPSGEVGKKMELALQVADFRKMFPIDWPHLRGK
jgi:ribosome-binding protein aMBF1 (putative translation factor)